jgi:hypothetical protein
VNRLPQKMLSSSRWLSAGLALGLCSTHLKAQVDITFLPPPLAGTISLGIYNKSGNLVRTLFKEASDKDFVVGLNGFITQWDGKDDTGQVAPPGKYLARGFSVGEIEVEGVAFQLNDWLVEDTSPRIREIIGIHLSPEGDLLLRCKLAGDKSANFIWTSEGTLRPCPQSFSPSPAATGSLRVRDALVIENGILREPEGSPLPSIAGLQKPTAACWGHAGTLWVVESTGSGSELRQYSASLDLVRCLKIPASEPQPIQIAAIKDRNGVFLLEKGERIQRLRGLEPAGATLDADGWTVFFSRSVETSDTFNSVANRLGGGKPLVSEPKVKVRLIPNPLFKDALQEIQVKLGIDREGAVLMESSGLTLCGLTSTPNLKWASLVPDGSKALRIFQSDGSVVEEFRARKLANMMAFDAGEYEVAVPAPSKQK